MTGIILVAVALALVVYDIAVAELLPKGNTISEVVARTALSHPILPFAVGVLCGHFFWPL